MPLIVNDTRPHLTRDERQLLAAISRHCRTAGWRWGHASGFTAPDKSLDVDWSTYHRDHNTLLQIGALTKHGGRAGAICTAEIISVREAVDIACAYGLLPQDFSSAYRTPRYTDPLLLTAGEVDVGWLLLDASDELTWHPITAVLACEDEHAEPFDPGTGPMPGYIAGRCGHRVAESEWRAGFRVCERCPETADTECTILVSAAYQAGEAHMPSEETVNVRIPAATR